MKFSIVIVITIFLLPDLQAQCPSNENTSIEVKEEGVEFEVILTFAKEHLNIQELKVIKFGSGVVEQVVIRKINNKKYSILGLKSGEYMVMIVGENCTSYVGTNGDYRGFMIK